MVDEVLRARVAALGIRCWLAHTAFMPLVTPTAVLARKHHINLRPRMTGAEPGGLRRGRRRRNALLLNHLAYEVPK